MKAKLLEPAALARALHLRDLTDERQGPHAVQALLAEVHTALARAWGCARLLHRGSPVVALADNYDALGYPSDGAARDARYTRYVTEQAVLRSQTSASIPALLRALALDPPEDVLLIVPGLVYRRDVIDKLHVGEPHQVDLWRISAKKRLGEEDLKEMIEVVLAAALPGQEALVSPSPHPYTQNGKQLDVGVVEIGECGLADPALLSRCGLDPAHVSGLAMGLGLDRLLMLRKDVPDIRLLREPDPRVARQMLDLAPYRPVSKQPATMRDLSLAVAAELTPEELGDRLRERAAQWTDCLESVDVLSETPYAALPEGRRERMGMTPAHKNVLLRLRIRHPSRTLTSEEANRVRDEVYRALHEGARLELALSPPSSPT